MRRDGPLDPLRSGPALQRQAIGVRDAREAESQRAERRTEGRRGAAVDGDAELLRRAVRHLRHRRPDQRLAGRVEVEVARGVRAEEAGQGQEARVLARAVVVDPARLVAALLEGAARGRIARRLRPAPESLLAQLEPAEQPPGRADVGGLGVVARDGEAELLVGQADPVGGAGLQQREHLEALHRAAREEGMVHGARGLEHGPRRVHQAERTAVDGLHAVPAPGPGQDGVVGVGAAARLGRSRHRSDSRERAGRRRGRPGGPRRSP